MSPEYGATMGFFPVDHVTLQYLRLTGRSLHDRILFTGEQNVCGLQRALVGEIIFVILATGSKYCGALYLWPEEVKPWIKTSLAPGSGVVTKYLQKSGLQKYLNQLGFHIVGYGCTTCIGNSGDIEEAVASAISENDIVAAAVLSGNRNFEGRVHPLTRANYLASPPLVVAYALAGTRYRSDGQGTIILAGAEYGSGSSRDWAAKGPMLLGVKAVIAKSFERIHRSNLVGMGIIPLCFKLGEDADTLGLTGHEQFTIDLPNSVRDIRPGQDVTVVTTSGKSFVCILRFDTEVELAYFDHGGILQYAIRNLIGSNH
ncbi:hypothetical protein SAY87_017038 [Trapa incisa]|uniref:Aconitase/3-isopropylmalate dehydratase large subunit alpha/beta/alpha domain-containing protein n=1 Tax=Trapa incisa TaxID=236973 RepID=A0AAN7QVU6_9MYRT|nr:hypothetical protein SAY87_017038 [Trapa incisa]